MRFNIVKKIDTKLLDEAIDKYYSMFSYCERPYLIMSAESCKDLTGDAKDFELQFKACKACVYKGISIAICNEIPYGEVEIR